PYRRIKYQPRYVAREKINCRPPEVLSLRAGDKLTGRLVPLQGQQGRAEKQFALFRRSDGMDVGNVLAQPGDDSKTMTLPPDALQEFTFITADPPAEFGNEQGGIVNFTVRSGTNHLHGTAYEFNMGNYLQARNSLQQDLTRYTRNEYGFVVGGPIYIPHVYNGKDRSFFLFNFNGWSTESRPQASLFTLPTAQEVTGDFSDFPLPIYDPATTTKLPDGTFSRQQFSCNGRVNVICADHISPISAK